MKASISHDATDVKGEELHKFLSFRMGNENLGIGILCIKEIIEYDDVTPVPMMPEFIRGAINLRGHAVPVIDLSARLGRGLLDISRRTCIVVVEVMANNIRMDVGVTVDAVNEVLDIYPSDIEPAPSLGGIVRTDFIKGMGKVNDRFVILLDIDRILSHKDLNLLGNVSGDGGDVEADGLSSDAAEPSIAGAVDNREPGM